MFEEKDEIENDIFDPNEEPISSSYFLAKLQNNYSIDRMPSLNKYKSHHSCKKRDQKAKDKLLFKISVQKHTNALKKDPLKVLIGKGKIKNGFDY